MHVRRVTLEDAEALREVRLAALAADPGAFCADPVAEAALGPHAWEERARTGSSGPGRATFLAWDGDAAVGMVEGLRRDDPDTVHLLSLWVAPTARGRGVGQALVGAVVTWAGATEARRVVLWVVEGNLAAEALYRRLGFVLTPDRQGLPSDPRIPERRWELAIGVRA